MDNLIIPGIILALIGGLAVFAGIITVIVGAAAAQKKTLKYGVRILLIGAVGLLCSFTLCSISFKS